MRRLSMKEIGSEVKGQINVGASLFHTWHQSGIYFNLSDVALENHIW